jgi:hypothetical protein
MMLVVKRCAFFRGLVKGRAMRSRNNLVGVRRVSCNHVATWGGRRCIGNEGRPVNVAEAGERCRRGRPEPGSGNEKLKWHSKIGNGGKGHFLIMG